LTQTWQKDRVSSSYSLGLSLSFLLFVGCSASRGERLESECLTSDQCAPGQSCEGERCVQVEIESVSAVGRVQGAPEGVAVQASDAAGNACTQRDGQGVVCQLAAGENLVLLAPTIDGYRFVGWSGSAGCSGEVPRLELPGVSANVECVAHYVRRLRVTGRVADAEGGPLDASSTHPAARCEAGVCELDEGTAAVLTAPERDGQRLVGITGEGCEQVEGRRATVTAVGKDVTCTATYIASLTVRGQARGVVAQVVAEPISTGPTCQGQLCAIDPGQSVRLTAPVVAGFRFVGWTGDAACLGAEPTLSLEGVSSNLVCTAEYVPRVKVVGQSQGAAGAITAASANQFSTCAASACEVDVGETVTLSAGTVSGFRLKRWSGLGCEPGSGASALVRNVQVDTACIAEYAEGVSVSGEVVHADAEVLAVSSSSGANCGRGSCSLDIGGTVTLTAPALPGRTFRGWSGDPSCAGSERVLVLASVSDSKNCSAVYAPRFDLAGRATPLLGGSVRASSTAPNASCSGARCQVDDGSAVTLVATPGADYRFVSWSGGSKCTGGEAQLSVADVRASATCLANFVARLEVTATAAPSAGGSAIVSSSATAASCDATGARCELDAGSNAVLRATPNAGYRFVEWSDCRSLLSSTLSQPELNLRSLSSSQRCTANFERITYAVAAAVGTGSGQVSASTGGMACASATCSVVQGGSALLVAVPSAGYRFGSWSGGAACAASGERAMPANVQANLTCTANFIEIPKYTITGSAGPGGTVSCAAGCVVEQGQSQQLVAVPDSAAGYRFAGWQGCTGSASGAQMTYTNVQSSETCRATFQRYVTVRVTSGSPPTPLDPTQFSFTPRDGCAGSACTVPAGSSLRITVPSSTGNVSAWGCVGMESWDEVSESLTLSNLNADVTCTLSWLVLF
jgi:hypothetical protein